MTNANQRGNEADYSKAVTGIQYFREDVKAKSRKTQGELGHTALSSAYRGQQADAFGNAIGCIQMAEGRLLALADELGYGIESIKKTKTEDDVQASHSMTAATGLVTGLASGAGSIVAGLDGRS